MKLSVAVMITSHNRCSDLERTLNHLSKLDPAPLEIIVTADGCEDATENLVRENFSTVTLLVNSPGLGSVASRHRMMQHTSADLVLSLDDDSYPEESDCLVKLSDLFEEQRQLAVATFPQRTDEYPETLGRTAALGERRAVRSFVNSGACLRVSTYRQLPGFEAMFFHAYEEPDYALQCIADGWLVEFNPVITIRHHYTPEGRSEIRTHHRHARNECWSALIRCPLPWSLGLVLFRVMSQGRYALSRGFHWLLREPMWWIAALRGVPSAWRKRNPVSWASYRRWLKLPDL